MTHRLTTRNLLKMLAIVVGGGVLEWLGFQVVPDIDIDIDIDDFFFYDLMLSY